MNGAKTVPTTIKNTTMYPEVTKLTASKSDHTQNSFLRETSARAISSSTGERQMGLEREGEGAGGSQSFNSQCCAGPTGRS